MWPGLLSQICKNRLAYKGQSPALMAITGILYRLCPLPDRGEGVWLRNRREPLSPFPLNLTAPA